ncbi:MAG: hypothetical protein ACYC0C_01850 [Devosia sp.]
MRKVKLLGAALLAAVLLLPVSVGARQLTEAEKASLVEAVTAFDTAMQEADIEGIVGVVPPKVFEHIAAQGGLETEALIASVIEQTREVMASITFDSFGMNMSAASYKEAADGTPYVLIPTETVVDLVESGKIRAASDTLAMLDEGLWYLIRTDDASTLAIIKEIYPTYAAVEFPAGTMEAVE